MKIYNRELEQIENPELHAKVGSIIEKQIEFLVQTYGVDEKLLQDKVERLAIVERHAADATYFVEYNGEKKELPNSRSAAAFVTRKKQEYDGDKWSFESGIYMSDTNGEHKVIHELFHFLSQKQQMEFDENGIGYTKSGISMSGYDRQENLVDNSINAEGLNEGITELLATKFDIGSNPEAYDFQTYIADILISEHHNSLVKSYFSEDEKDFGKFLDEFDKQQNTISSKKLIEMSTDGQPIADTKLLKGCLEYALSFCKDIDELKAERKRLLPIFKGMSENINIEFDNKQLELKEFFNDILLKKKEEIENRVKSNDGKTILASAIEATKEVTKESQIEEQEKVISKIERNQIEQIKGIE